MPVPNFLIIGPPKCGTTALYAALACHPQIYMSPVKEPRFFAFDGQPPSFSGPGDELYNQCAITSWEEYLSLFAAADGHTALGEASPVYLTSFQPERTAENIWRRLPDIRLIAILRQPVERAYSHFTSRRQLGIEPLADFREALAAEEQRIAANWSPGFRDRRNGMYFANLAPYFEHFPRNQIRIYLYEALIQDPQSVLTDLCHFLKVDPTLMPGSLELRNVTTWPRSRLLAALLRRAQMLKALLPLGMRRTWGTRLRAWNRIKPPPLDPDLHRELTESYRQEVVNLQSLIDHDLAHWLARPGHSSPDSSAMESRA